MSGGQTPSTEVQSTNSNSNSNSTSSTGPNSAISGMLGNLANTAGDWFSQNPTAPAYPAQTVAPQSAATQQALNSIASFGASGGNAGLNNQGQSLVSSILNGDFLDVGSNPYLQGSIAAANAPGTAQLINQILPANDSQYEGMGRPGSGLNAQLNQQAINNLQTTQAGAADQTMLGAYQNAQNQQMTALGLLPSFQNMDYQNLNAELGAGQAQDQYQQSLTDAAVQQYLYGTTAQPNWLLNASQILQGIYPGSQTTGSSNTSGSSSGFGSATPSSNPTASAIGAGTTMAGIGLSAAIAL
jgi:hypothetical protein